MPTGPDGQGSEVPYGCSTRRNTASSIPG